MRVIITGKIESYKGTFQDMISIAEELGMKVIFQTSENPNLIPFMVKEAILEVTGMSFEVYTEKNRSRNEYFARLIFAHQCIHRECMTICEIAAALKRNESNVQKYKGKYEIEMKVNKGFRRNAKRVNDFLNKCVSV